MARSSSSRRKIRQLARQARERTQLPATAAPLQDPAAESDAPITGIPVESEEGSTILEAPKLLNQAETATLPSIKHPVDPNEETEGGEDLPLASDLVPPPLLRFSCPCGAALVANREIYDKRMTCPDCKETLLVTVLYQPRERQWRIESLRVTPIPE